MRHRVGTKKFGIGKDYTKSLLRNLMGSLILAERIKTTQKQAKAIKGPLDKIITLGKKRTLSSKRELLKKIPNRKVIEKLTEEIIPRFLDRTSGFTRIIRLGPRVGDAAPMVLIEFVQGPSVNEKTTPKEKSLKIPKKEKAKTKTAPKAKVLKKPSSKTKKV